jgi:hypothetical protein
MNESELNNLHDRVSKRKGYIVMSLQQHVPIDALEEVYQTHVDLLQLIEHIQQFPQDEIDRLLKR